MLDGVWLSFLALAMRIASLLNLRSNPATSSMLWSHIQVGYMYLSDSCVGTPMRLSGPINLFMMGF